MRFFLLTKLKMLLLAAFFVMSAGITFAQTQVSGTVSDTGGEPLPGVYVMETGTSNGVMTDIDGKYSISVSENATLKFSFIGYTPKEIQVSTQTTIDVQLVEDTRNIDEVVVVGYGTMKKTDLTGAVSSITGDALKKAASNRPIEAIQGRVAGLSITKNSGQPGAGMKVRIRGVGSTNNSDPLYVVDGVPSGNDIEHIAPEDIESIEVLKDASSTAIYGNKGANGVIIVTTKSGKVATKPTFSFNAYYGIGQVPNTIDLLDATGLATLIKEAAANDGISLPTDLNTRIAYVLDNNSVGTDWQNEIFRVSSQKNYNLSVRGGFSASDNPDRKLVYSVSGTMFDEEGIVENTQFSKYLLNSKTEYQYNKHIKLGVNLDIFHKENGDFSQGIYNGPIPQALTASPMDYPRDANGNPVAAQTSNFQNNPLLFTDHQKHTNNTTNSYGLRTWLDIDIIEGLNFKTTLNMSKGFTHNKVYRPSYYLSENFYRTQSELYEGRGEWNGWTWINLVNYNKTFGENHKIIATIGHEASYNKSYGFGGTGLDVPMDEDLQYLSLSKEYKEQLGAWQSHIGTISYFGRAFYSYANKYMITGTVRYDGSSKFSGDNKWGLFPSVGASWRLDQEGFIRDLNIFSALKLRAGWGQVGNEASAQAGSDLANIGKYGMYYVFNDQLYQGGITTNIPTPDLRWEVVETSNLGIDVELLEGALAFTADYFIKDTKDMITRVALPGYYPKDLPNANIGTMSNKGFEFSASYRKQTGDFQYSVGANISVIKNEIVKLNADDEAYIDGGYIDKLGYTTRTEKGKEIAYFYGYQTDGIFSSQEEIDNHANKDGDLLQPDAVVGDIKFVNTDGDDKLDADDRVYLGSGMPDFTAGFNFSMSYKGFDFSGNIYAVYGNEIVNGMSLRLLDVNDYYNAYADRMERFHPDNNPGGTQPRVTLSDNNNNLRFSDRYVEDGSYIRLKNLQLGYTLPSSITEKIKVDKLRVYVSGQNLLTFTNYKGYDPEIGDLTHDASGDVSALGIGVDLGNYPQPRLVYFGVNVNF